MPKLDDNDIRMVGMAGYHIPWDLVKETLEPELPKVHVDLSKFRKEKI